MNSQPDYFEEVYYKYSAMLYRIAIVSLGKKIDAEDCVSEVFVKLIKHGERFKDKAHEKAWLIKVMINLCKNRKRDAYNRKTTFLEDIYPCICNELSLVELKDSLSKLPVKENIALYLKYVEGYTAEEIGKMTGMTAGGVRTLLFRGRESFKNQL